MKADLRSEAYAALLGSFFGPFDRVSDETDAKLWAATDAIVAILRDALLSEEAVEAATRGWAESIMGRGVPVYEHDKEHARSALSAALAKIGLKQDQEVKTDG